MKNAVCIAVVVVSVLMVRVTESREWTDVTGKHKTEADFVEYRDGKVFLKQGDRVVSIPFATLSESDQQHIERIAKRPSGNKGIAVEKAARGKWAILVGVEDYAEAQDLTYCGDDVRALRAQLVSMGFADDHIFLLHDDAKDRKWLPVKANIEAALDLVLGRVDVRGERLVEEGLAKENDIIVLAFSGHGIHLDGESYLCPTEARLDRPNSLISLERIYKQLEFCPAAMKLLLVDACRNDPRPNGRKGIKATEEVSRFAKSLERPPRGVLVLQSCAAGQVSVEDDKLGHGVFMYYLVQGLAGSADRLEGNRDGLVSLLELYRYSSGKTKLHVARSQRLMQTPSLRGEISGDFDLGAATAVPKIEDDPAVRLFTADAVNRARRIVREAYEADYRAARSPKQKAALVSRIIRDAQDSTTAVDGYVGLEVAREIAVRARNADLALEAADQLKKSFGIDASKMKFDVLARIQATSSLATQQRSLVPQIASVVNEVISQDRFDIAVPLAELANLSATRSNDQQLRRTTEVRLFEVRNLAAEYQTVQAARIILKTTPADPDANLVVGRFYCLTKGEWDRGLPMLVVGNDEDLKGVARLDMAQPKDAASQIQVADAWWALADAFDARARNNVLLRARHWYQQAIPDLSGIPKAKVAKRLDQLRGLTGNAKASFTNSIGMKLVKIPAGEFKMGSPSSEGLRSGDETQHAVRLSKGFYMSTTEVTQGQFKALMGTTPWQDRPYAKENADHAASYIDWNGATEYCVRLSKKEGRKYRLPTEAEWEYACRGGTTTAYSFGNEAGGLKDYAWFQDNAEDVGEKYAHKVGQKRANAFGLYDIHGNVYEWCSDWYDEDYYSKSPSVDPKGPTSGSSRVLRGGSWFYYAQFCRSAFRVRLIPTDRRDVNGFRVVCELD